MTSSYIQLTAHLQTLGSWTIKRRIQQNQLNDNQSKPLPSLSVEILAATPRCKGEAGDLWLRQMAPKRLRLGMYGQDQNSRLNRDDVILAK